MTSHSNRTGIRPNRHARLWVDEQRGQVVEDPVDFVHDAPSWYDFSPIDAGHYAATQFGIDAHFDAFNGVLLFPLHEGTGILPVFPDALRLAAAEGMAKMAMLHP
jgi:hypothetical protein